MSFLRILPMMFITGGEKLKQTKTKNITPVSHNPSKKLGEGLVGQSNTWTHTHRATPDTHAIDHVK